MPWGAKQTGANYQEKQISEQEWSSKASSQKRIDK